jgi:quercetin dioxygenase-like cupin family protein
MQAAEVILDAQGGRIEVWPHGRPANGAHYRFEWYLAPGTAGLPQHFHPHQEERLQVISGLLVVRIEGQSLPLGPGERLVIPAGVSHACGNPLRSETHVRAEFVPGLQIDRFFRTLFAVERSRRGLDRLAAWAMLCSEEPEHVGFPSRLGVPIRLGAALARRLGRGPAS